MPHLAQDVFFVKQLPILHYTMRDQIERKVPQASSHPFTDRNIKRMLGAINDLLWQNLLSNFLKDKLGCRTV